MGRIKALRGSNFKSHLFCTGSVSVGVGGGGDVKNRVGGLALPLSAELTQLLEPDE